MAEVLAAHDLAAGRVRITVTGGVGPARLGARRGRRPTVVVAAGAADGRRPPTAAVCVVPWPRNERGAMAGIKTTSYAENVVALAYAKERGCSRGDLRQHRRRTCARAPAPTCSSASTAACSPRRCRPAAWPASPASSCSRSPTPSRRTSRWPRFRDADEVFLTSTGRDVQPVHRVDDRDLPDPGPLTRPPPSAFRALVATTDDP